MKKILVITALFGVSLSSNIYAQCTPDPAVVTAGIPGLYPIPTDGISSGIVGTAYSQVFTVIVPADSTISIPPAPATTLAVNSATVTQMYNLPAGLQFDCDITNCVFPGDSEGCILLDGTPTAAGTYPLQVEFILNVEVPFLGPQDVPAQTIEYTLVIDTLGTISINPVSSSSAFEVFPITPNPSSDQAEIRFTVSDYRDVSFSVHNMIGAVVISKKIYAEKGLNVVSLNTEKLNPGVYFVTLTDGINTPTKRLVVGSR